MELALGINQGKNLSLICNMWDLHARRRRSARARIPAAPRSGTSTRRAFETRAVFIFNSKVDGQNEGFGRTPPFKNLKRLDSRLVAQKAPRHPLVAKSLTRPALPRSWRRAREENPSGQLYLDKRSHEVLNLKASLMGGKAAASTSGRWSVFFPIHCILHVM